MILICQNPPRILSQIKKCHQFEKIKITKHFLCRFTENTLRCSLYEIKFKANCNRNFHPLYQRFKKDIRDQSLLMQGRGPEDIQRGHQRNSWLWWATGILRSGKGGHGYWADLGNLKHELLPFMIFVGSRASFPIIINIFQKS